MQAGIANAPITKRELLNDWFRRVRENQHVHYRCSTFFHTLNYVIGVPACLVVAATGTAFFGTLIKQSSTDVKPYLAAISILGAMLTALQTFLRLPKIEEQHRATAAVYAGLRRKIEMQLTMAEDELTADRLDDIRKKMDAAATGAPQVPGFIQRFFRPSELPTRLGVTTER